MRFLNKFVLRFLISSVISRFFNKDSLRFLSLPRPPSIFKSPPPPPHHHHHPHHHHADNYLLKAGKNAALFHQDEFEHGLLYSIRKRRPVFIGIMVQCNVFAIYIYILLYVRERSLILMFVFLSSVCLCWSLW